MKKTTAQQIEEVLRMRNITDVAQDIYDVEIHQHSDLTGIFTIDVKVYTDAEPNDPPNYIPSEIVYAFTFRPGDPMYKPRFDVYSDYAESPFEAVEFRTTRRVIQAFGELVDTL